MLSGSVLRALVRSWGSNGSSTRLLASVVFPRSLTPTGLVIRLPQCVVLTSHQAHEGIQACRVTLQVANRIKIRQHPKYRRGRRPAPPKPGLTAAQLPAECKVVRSASPHRSDPCFQPPSPVYQSIPRTLSPTRGQHRRFALSHRLGLMSCWAEREGPTTRAAPGSPTVPSRVCLATTSEDRP